MASLTVTVLGSSGSYAGPGLACSGYLVRCHGTAVWIDAGSGTLANLQRHVGLGDVDGIVLTHEHPDHWSDVEGFSVASHHVHHLPPVPVWAPAGLRRRLMMSARPFIWNEVGEASRIDIGPLAMVFSRTDHPVETLAVRVEGAGRALGYSADTGPGWSLEALGPGLDVALCEATFLQDQEGLVQHMSARQAGTSARRAGARRLVITHLLPTIDRDLARAEAAAAFGGPVEVAHEGLEVQV